VELNSFSGGGKPGVSDTFASALWALDLLFTLSFYDGAGLNLETGLNQLGFVSSYSPIFDDQRGHLTARPSYYAMLAFATAGRGKRIRIDITGPRGNCSAYAVVDDTNHVWVTLINKDVSGPAHVVLTSQSKFAGGELMRLSAPSFQATTGVSLAGAQVSPEGMWRPKEIGKLRPTRGQLAFHLAPASAVLVRLRDRKGFDRKV
jgi:hypothetical protein